MKVIAKGGNFDKATCIAILLQSGMWDLVTEQDREAFTERGEILDTPGGQALCQRFRITPRASVNG